MLHFLSSFQKSKNIFCYKFIRNFRKRNFLWGKDIVEWKIKSRGLFWHLTGILLKVEGLNQKVKMQKCLNWEKC